MRNDTKPEDKRACSYSLGRRRHGEDIASSGLGSLVLVSNVRRRLTNPDLVSPNVEENSECGHHPGVLAWYSRLLRSWLAPPVGFLDPPHPSLGWSVGEFGVPPGGGTLPLQAAKPPTCP